MVVAGHQVELVTEDGKLAEKLANFLAKSVG
jgi:hypothetical protein